ncbi:MAG: AI-2E family transporter [Clostridiales Family XIII bacterium]|jgi:predicted PurR-regulated permease PerM|nr:AI-2E family transporter [Clostridiales Family XIII bacterium]
MTENREGENLKGTGDIGVVLPKDTQGRILTIAVLVLILMTIWFMLELSILTFILTFVFYRLQRKIRRSFKSIPGLRRIPRWLIIVLLYIAIILVAVWAVLYILPIIVKQATEIAAIFSSFDLDKAATQLDSSRFAVIFQNLDINAYINSGGNLLGSMIVAAGKIGMDFVLALALSFILILEKRKIKAITQKLETSKIAYIYKHLNAFGRSFCNTFGKVMRVQLMIASINSVLSMVILSILGFSDILALGVMILILGLIPVAGVIISLVPLSIIAFNFGGLTKVIQVLIMIIVIHVIEAYVLNPKLMSAKTALPASIVFIVLIVSEYYLGAWGLLIGVPIFIFLLNTLGVDYESAVVRKPQIKSPRKVAISIIDMMDLPRKQPPPEDDLDLED